MVFLLYFTADLIIVFLFVLHFCTFELPYCIYVFSAFVFCISLLFIGYIIILLVIVGGQHDGVLSGSLPIVFIMHCISLRINCLSVGR